MAETVVVDCEERRRTYAGFGLMDGSWDGWEETEPCEDREALWKLEGEALEGERMGDVFNMVSCGASSEREPLDVLVGVRLIPLCPCYRLRLVDFAFDDRVRRGQDTKEGQLLGAEESLEKRRRGRRVTKW